MCRPLRLHAVSPWRTIVTAGQDKGSAQAVGWDEPGGLEDLRIGQHHEVVLGDHCVNTSPPYCLSPGTQVVRRTKGVRTTTLRNLM